MYRSWLLLMVTQLHAMTEIYSETLNEWKLHYKFYRKNLRDLQYHTELLKIIETVFTLRYQRYFFYAYSIHINTTEISTCNTWVCIINSFLSLFRVSLYFRPIKHVDQGYDEITSTYILQYTGFFFFSISTKTANTYI